MALRHETGGCKVQGRTFPLPLPPMIAVRDPAGKSADTAFRIFFLRIRAITSPSTSPTLGFLSLTCNASTKEVATSTSTSRFRTVISTGCTSEKERVCRWLSVMRHSISAVSWDNEPFSTMSTSSIPSC